MANEQSRLDHTHDDKLDRDNDRSGIHQDDAFLFKRSTSERPQAPPQRLSFSAFAIATLDGVTRGVWPYRGSLANYTDQRIRLIGRQIYVEQGSFKERVPLRGFAPSLWGTQPEIDPGKKIPIDAAIATRAMEPPKLTVTFEALDLQSNERFTIVVPSLTLASPAASAEPLASKPLETVDAALLRRAVDAYQRDFQRGAAVFRTDEWPFSPDARLSITATLIEAIQLNREKAAIFDLSSLVGEPKLSLILQTDDHYFKSNELFHTDNQLPYTYILTYNMPVLPEHLTYRRGATDDEKLDRILAIGRRDFGANFLHLLSARASAAQSDSAQINMGMAVREIPNAAPQTLRAGAAEITSHHGSSQQAIFPGVAEPQVAATITMSPEDLKEFANFSDLHQWTPSCGRPSDFIRDNFSKWFGQGLYREIIEDLQPLLAQEYREEITRNPRRRIKEIQRPHKLPPNAPPLPPFSELVG